MKINKIIRGLTCFFFLIATAAFKPGSEKEFVVNTRFQPLPTSITFEREVVQQVRDDETGNKSTITYYFTVNGDYAAVKMPKEEDGDEGLFMVYAKGGATWMFDDKRKKIIVMNMAKTMGEGIKMGVDAAEAVSKKKLPKQSKEEEEFTLVKTGKTKLTAGYTAEEYQLKNKKGEASSIWYAKVDFDPVKIYTLGAGRGSDPDKIKNDPKFKNNMFAIPVLNKNYLLTEVSSGGQTGTLTISIKPKNFVVYTVGYKVEEMKSLKDMLKKSSNE